MRVGLVRNSALGMVALVGLGLAGCDDTPTDFEPDETVKITANPTTMVVPAGMTALLTSRTENQGNEPTWEEITPTVDGSCGSGAITVAVSDDFEPSIQPPGVFDVTGGNTLGDVCIQLAGGGATRTVTVTVVGDSLAITGSPAGDTLNLFESVDLSAALFSEDGSEVGPFDPDADIVWSSDDTAVLEVDQTGVVTSVGTGAATITATWTDAGATVTADQVITTNAPTLAIVPSDPDSLLIDTTIDLDVTFMNPTDPPATFGPFDPATDVTWFTVNDDGDAVQENDVIAVDAATGEVTALGPGSSTVTVVWEPSVIRDEDDAIVNNPVEATVDIDVDIPTPTIASATPNTGNLGDLITITGTGFHEAMSILVDENELEAAYEPTIVNATTATFHMPFGEDGPVSVQVGASGQLSDEVTVTRTITDVTGEPGNDEYATATPVTVPVDLWGTVDGVDADDRFAFSLAVETTLSLSLDWAGPSGDLDLLVLDNPPTAFQCDFATATASHPEAGECTLPAGDYILWVNSYDHEIGVYHLEVSVAVP